MKKLTLVFSIGIFALSCENEDLLVAPDGNEPTVVKLEVEEAGANGIEDQIFMVVEETPEYPGGQKAYNKFLLENLNYPKQAREEGIEGRVFISYVVNEDGSLSDYQLVRGIGGGCDEEALRVFMEMPDWTPGEQRGRKVKVRMQSAVTFKLSGGNGPVTIVNEGKP